MSVNLTDLELLIVDKVANTTSEEELLIYSKILSKLKNQYVNTVDTYAELPAAADNEGEISFVEDLNRVFYSNGVEWKRITNEVPVETSTLYHMGVGIISGNPLYACIPSTQPIIDSPSRPAENTILTDITCVSAGYNHALGLKNNGTLWAWGINCGGKLGNLSTSSSYSPIEVCGGFTDWCTISSGSEHSTAIRTNGTLWAWGSASYGKLGNNNSYDSQCSPVSIVGGFTDWCAVSAAECHSAAIRTNGTLWTWGKNVCGILGDNSGVFSRSSPVSVVCGFTDWCDVSVGKCATYAVRANGTMWSWGANTCGKLGLGLSGPYDTWTTPQEITMCSGSWTQVSTQRGCHGVWALKDDGTIWGWGDNQCSIVGSATGWSPSVTGCVVAPESVLGGITDYICIGETWSSSVAALRANGVVMAWGIPCLAHMGTQQPSSVIGNEYPQFIFNLDDARSSPICVFNEYNDWCFVSQGGMPNWPTSSQHTYLIRLKS